jgi:hypothetical protein
MNRTTSLIASGAALLLTLMLAAQSKAQSPTPIVRQIDPSTDVLNPRRLNLVALVRGEVRLSRGSINVSDLLSCGPASSHGSYVYGAFSTEEVTLKFSFAQTRPATGSWAIRRRALRGTLAGPPVIMAGNFTGGVVNLTAHPLPFPPLPPNHFLFTGRTTNSDGHCFDSSQQKDIRITGRCDRPQDGINFAVFTGSQIYARGTFSSVIDVSCSVGLASSVDLTLNGK